MARLTVALVIPTKDKLDHLKRTLPTAAKLGFDEVIVVDSSTKEKAEVEELCRTTGARYVFSPVDRLRARNLGAKTSASDWVCIADDDIVFSKFDFGKFQQLALEADFMVGGWGRSPGAHYAWIFRREFFIDVLKGYDLMITGGDDLDITLRADRMGRGVQVFGTGLYESEAIGLAISKDYPSKWIRNKVLYALTMYPLVRRYPWLVKRVLLSEAWKIRSGSSIGRSLYEGFIEKSGLAFSPLFFALRKRESA